MLVTAELAVFSTRWLLTATSKLHPCPFDPVSVAEVDYQFVQGGWEVGFDFDFMAKDGMDEAEGLGVERLAVELGLAGRLAHRAIGLLADDGVAHFGHVDADLVSPTGLQPAGEQSCD